MTSEFVVRDEVTIQAPLERCFLLSTSVEIVARELRMHPVRGRTSGFVQEGDRVLWKGWKFGLPQIHESIIEEFRPCGFFRDRMIAGRFKSFEHDHRFDLLPDGSVHLRDEIRFTMPWGWVGEIVGILLLRPHIRRLLRRRFGLLKRIAETEEWRQYITARDASAAY